jgi:hypothetical protein
MIQEEEHALESLLETHNCDLSLMIRKVSEILKRLC